MLVSTAPTLTLAPSRIRQPSRNENGTSPGQQAVVAVSGRDRSYRRESGDEGIAIRECFVGAIRQQLGEDGHRPLTLGERRVQRCRTETEQVGRAKVGDHATGTQSA